MSKWMGAAGWSAKEARAGDRLPYARLVDQHTVLLRDGSLMTALQVPGLLFETEDSEALNAHAASREVMLRSTLDARFVLYHHVIRRKVEVEMDAAFPDPISAHVDQRWQERLGSGSLFINDQFITLVRRPARGKAGLAERAGKALKRRKGEGGLIEAGSQGSARAEGRRDRPGRVIDGLWRAVAGRLRGHRRARQFGNAGAALRALQWGDAPRSPAGRRHRHRRHAALQAGELRPRRDGAARIGRAGVRGCFRFKDYPDATSPGLLDSLLRLPYEMVVSESYAPTERQTARERMDLALRRLRSADEEAQAERADMLAARDALGNGGVGFGDHHLSVLVRETQLDRLDDAVAACAASLADTGAIAVREDTNLEPAFWGQFPGNEGYLVRRAMISSANMASFGSLHGFALGQASGNHWGDAVALLETTSATPFFFNFHHGDLGNFSVIGPSGSGKTVVMNFLAAQAQKFRPRTILFDKDRGAELFIRGIGGRYDRIRAGEPSGFNPTGAARQPRQPRVPARMAGRAAERAGAGGRHRHRGRGGCGLHQ